MSESTTRAEVHAGDRAALHRLERAGRRTQLVSIVAVLVAALALIGFIQLKTSYDRANKRADTNGSAAATNGNTAQQAQDVLKGIAALCAEKRAKIPVAFCQRASDVASQPVVPVQGSTGATGATGPAGPAGPQGEPGRDGANGPKGDPGTPGPTGRSGTDGAPGTSGSVGPVGPQGPKGDSGDQGPAGAQGPAGVAGATGETGNDGTPGQPPVSWTYTDALGGQHTCTRTDPFDVSAPTYACS